MFGKVNPRNKCVTGVTCEPAKSSVRKVLRQLCTVTSINIKNKNVASAYSYKLAISTGPVSNTLPTYTIIPDATGCPPLKY
jgi:hypothetical protein